MNQSVLIFWQMFRRDMYVTRPQIGKLVFNNLVLVPLMYIFTYAYMQVNIFFGTDSYDIGSSISVGIPLLLLLLLSYNFTVPLIFDIEGDAFINYQITLLNPRLVLFERILFSALLTFVLIVPFYPLVKLVLGDYFYTEEASWLLIYLFLFLGSFLVCAYHFFIICSLKSSHLIARIWSRYNDPLLIFGGYWIPWYVMNKFSSVLGFVTHANPFLYLTEGLRQAFFHDPKFFSMSICFTMLTFYSVLFTMGTMYCFKKRMDHI